MRHLANPRSMDRSCRYSIQDIFFWRLAGPVALPRQEISIKSLPDLLWTDMERVCGLKNSHKTNPLCNLFIHKSVRAGP